MPLEFIAAQSGLARVLFWRADDDRLPGSLYGLAQQLLTGLLVEMFDHVAHENHVVTGQLFDQLAGVAHVDLVVEITMHRGEVRRVAFDAIDSNLPILSVVPAWVIFRFVDVGVFPEQVAPFAKAHADIENRARAELTDQVNDRRDRVGPAARHLISG